ncbi:aldo/keto reductase [Alteromonadaceae bacterium BrNp21-10]|nr:aldo/keto reductase [Alteromonadaceae bacterium BrNp21-10]
MQNASGLTQLPKFIYGTTRLGDDSIDFDERVKIAHYAMESCSWFHVSDQYGSAISVLAEAFKQKPDAIPKMIFKVEGESIEELRDVIQRNIEPLGVKHMDIGQLCLRGELAEQYAQSGACYQDIEQLRSEGVIKQFVKEVFPWSSEVTYQALKAGHDEQLVDGYIFYLNPLQRFALNPLWDLIQQKDKAVIAMRTVCGNTPQALRDVPGAAWKEYIQQRAVDIAPLFESSGIKNWADFCVGYALAHSQVQATVGSSARRENIDALVNAAQAPTLIDDKILKKITALHQQWSDSLDQHAEPWSM